MGGTLYLLMHLCDRWPEVGWCNTVLVAPMSKIFDSIHPQWPIPQVLTFISRLAPTLPIIPTIDLVGKLVKVEVKQKVATGNPLQYQGKPRVVTMVELLWATDDLGSCLSEVTPPFLMLHGSTDVVTNPVVNRVLYDAAQSKDKIMRIYEGMMHSLLFGKTQENVALICNDFLTWLNERCKGA